MDDPSPAKCASDSMRIGGTVTSNHIMPSNSIRLSTLIAPWVVWKWTTPGFTSPIARVAAAGGELGAGGHDQLNWGRQQGVVECRDLAGKEASVILVAATPNIKGGLAIGGSLCLDRRPRFRHLIRDADFVSEPDGFVGRSRVRSSGPSRRRVPLSLD